MRQEQSSKTGERQRLLQGHWSHQPFGLEPSNVLLGDGVGILRCLSAELEEDEGVARRLMVC
jgi:hypothetical protein